MLQWIENNRSSSFNVEEHWQWPNLKKLFIHEHAEIQPDAFLVTSNRQFYMHNWQLAKKFT